jgi:hypothetical protein
MLSKKSDNDDSSRPEMEPWHEQQSINQSKTTKAGPRGGISKRIQEIQIQIKLKLKLN